MNILAEFKKLKETVATFLSDQSKATLANITEFSSKLTALESGALAQVAAHEATIAQRDASITELTANASATNKELTDLRAAIDGAVAALNLEAKADADYLGKVAALQSSVSTTLAKLNVPGDKIPAPALKATQSADVKTKPRAEFEAMHPKARMEFMRSGGKISG